tara:strand:+ start:420 stop:917 length:498 start_codon:yes stop_codon:yes gene_type:complete
MWAVIKFDKKKLLLLQTELKKKFGDSHQIYCPKILIHKFKNNKLVKKELNLLGDYLFCFNKEFSNTNTLNNIKYTKGVKFLLDGFQKSQNEIISFVNKCKEIENEEGYITQKIFETKINHFYKFSSGPFSEKIFKIIEMQKNKLKILMGNFTTIVDKRDYLLSPL